MRPFHLLLNGHSAKEHWFLPGGLIIVTEHSVACECPWVTRPPGKTEPNRRRNIGRPILTPALLQLPFIVNLPE